MGNIFWLGARVLACVAVITVAAPTSDIQHFGLDFWQAELDKMVIIDAATFQLAMEERDLQERTNTSSVHALQLPGGDICSNIQGCLGRGAATAANYAAVAAWSTGSACSNLADYAYNKMKEDNYALAKKAISFTVTKLIIPVAVIAPVGQLFINALIQNDAPQSKDDACGAGNKESVSRLAGGVTLAFCQQLRSITRDKAWSRWDMGTFSKDTTNDDIGLDVKMRMYISTEKGKNDKACQELGIWLKK